MRFVGLFSAVLLAVVLILPTSPSHAAHHRDGATATHEHDSNSADGAHGRSAAKSHAPTAHWSAPAAEKARPNPVPMSAEGLREAGALYRENCAACHGAEGQGDGPLAKDLERAPANLFAMAPHHGAGDLRWKIAKGRGEMPGWEETLSDEQIWLLVHCSERR